MNSKQLVYDTLEFRSPLRAPRHLWTLPWAEQRYPRQLAEIRAKYPDDITSCPAFLRESSPVARGDLNAWGEAVDEWGCLFTNIQQGVIGEVKQPLVAGEEWEDVGSVRFPTEVLTVDIAAANRFCAEHSHMFIMGGCCPRPFERLQFIRGTEALYMDLMDPPEALLAFIRKMHELYCEEMQLWAKTDVDALSFMDDWGGQQSLLINPTLWVKLFKPLYKDYIDIAHSHGKKAFMHSDGYILDIYPHLVELGLDALNSQVFCMGPENLSPWRGKITFWGEMDRQHLLPNGTPEDITLAVRRIWDTLWQEGGCIAQCEFGPGARCENVDAMFAAWQALV